MNRGAVQQSRAARPRGPGALYSVVSVVMLAVLSSVALSTRQPPPPTIAEFSPQAREQIEDAPAEQTSAEGTGAGDCPPGLADCDVAPTAAPTTAPTVPERPTIDVARVRRCVGDPPRQIEDPQSPPCVPFWEGDNGGATYQGVTANEIRIFAPVPGDDDGWVRRDVVDALERFFNTRFEFYGRQLRLIWDPRGNTGDEAVQKAVASEADEQHQVFGSTSWDWASGPFQREMARRKLVTTIGQGGDIFEDRELASLSPYVWSYPMSADGIFANLGEWACKRLVGGVAAHAGPQLAGQDRRFGVVVRPTAPGTHHSLDPLLGELERCGAHPEEVIVVSAEPQSTEAAAAETQNIVLRLRQSGVTSVFCLCDYFWLGQGLWRAATNQNYFPEWLISTVGLLDSDFGLKTWANHPPQAEHAFGLTFLPRQVPLADSPYWWAVQEINPSIPPGNPFYQIWWEQSLYRSLLLLASGIQMAGPNLTPETFAEGLRRTTFPNPDHPIMAGAVGFGGRPSSMTTDAAEWWWSSIAQSPYPQGGAGAVCYLDGGARHTKGNWPEGDGAFFQQPCDSGAG